MLWFSRKTLSGSHCRFSSTSRCQAVSSNTDRIRSVPSSKLVYAPTISGWADVGGEDEGTQQALDDQREELRLPVVWH
jgi:hypothetical protein